MKTLKLQHILRQFLFLACFGLLVQSTNGQTNLALNFDGSNDYINVGSWWNYQEFTVQMWINPTQNQNGYANIIDDNHSGGVRWVCQNWGGNTWIFGVAGSGEPGEFVFSLTPNIWQQLTLVKAVTEIRIYINGVLIGSDPMSGTITGSGGGDDIWIGNWHGGGRYFNGAMDDIRLWNYALTPTEIQSELNCELSGSETGLVAYYKLNQGTAGGNNTSITTAEDDSGDSHPGTLVGFNLIGSNSNFVAGTEEVSNCDIIYADLDGDGYGDPDNFVSDPANPPGYVDNNDDCNDTESTIHPFAAELCNGVDDNCNSVIDDNNVLNFDGGDDYIQMNSLIVPANGDFTVEFWVNSSSISEFKEFISQGSAGNAFYIGTTSGSPMIRCGDLWQTTGVNLPLNQWVHLAMTKSGTDATLYINGVLTATTNNYSISAEGTATRLGRQYGGYSEFPVASMDELRIWSIARTQTEIQNNLNIPLQAQVGLVANYHFDQGIAGGNNTAIPEVGDDSGNSNHGALINFAKTGTTSNFIAGMNSASTWYQDADNDGFGNPSVYQVSCTGAPSGFVSNNTDCNDGDDSVNPTAVEICNGIDDNCDGMVDFALPSGVKLFLPFSGNANDASGLGHNATVFNASLTTDRFAASNAAYSFNGYDARIEVPDHPDLRPASFTLSTWVYYNSIPGSLQNLVAKPLCGGWADSYAMWIWGGQLFFGWGSAPNSMEYYGFSPPPAGQWNHLVLTFDDAADQVRIYINNMLIATYYSSATIAYDNTPLTMGAEYENCNLGFWFDGKMDETILFNRALSPGEISSLYLLNNQFNTYYQDADLDGFGNPDISQLGCSPLPGFVDNNLDCNDGDNVINPNGIEICNGIDDNCDGLTDADDPTVMDTQAPVIICLDDISVGNDLGSCNATVSVPHPIVVDDCIGASSALHFDGSLQYVDPYTFPSVSNNFTIEMWVNPGAPHEIDGQSTGGADGVSGQRYALWPTHGFGWNGQDAGVGISVGTNGISVYEHADGYMPPLLVYPSTINGWTHLAVVYTNKQPSLYLNGTLVATGFISPRSNSHPSAGNGWAYSGQAGGIGGGSYGNFIGDIDEVRIWDFSRSPGEIQSDYQTHLTGGESGLLLYYDFEDGAGSSTTHDASPNNWTGTLTFMDPATDWIQSGSTVSSAFTLLNDFNNSSNASGVYPLGSTTVTWTASDLSGNSATCSSDVIVSDTEDPVISGCPSDFDTESETGQWGAHVTWTAPTAMDNCGMQSFTSSHPSGDFFNVGSTLVTYTALDIHGNTSTCTFNVNVSPPEILGDINLSVFANDIQFSNSNPPPGTFITISATVHNNSNEDAPGFVCHLVNQYDNTSYPDVTVPALGSNQSTVVNWIIQTPALPAFVPMQVTIDYFNSVSESNELDNQAVRPFINGLLPFGGRIVVVSGAIPYSSIAGSGISICGNAYYDDTAVPLDDPSVAGAQVTVTITETGQVINGVTNANGYFCVPYFTPNTAGLYHYIAAVTDFTLTGDTTGTFLLVPPPVDYCPKDLAVSMELFGSFLCGNVYNIVQGTSLTGVVHVSNSCKVISQPSTLYIALPDGTPVPGPFIIPALAPGQTYDVSLPAMTFNSLGATYISATVDFFNDVVEESETNNSRSITIQVHPPLPDIVPTSGHVSTNYQCTPANVSFRIENQGGLATGTFNTRLEIYHGPTLETTLSQTVGSIPALCNADIAFTFSPLFSGTYHFHLTCDTLPSGVTELVELNNHFSFSHYFNPCNLDLFVYECGSMDVKPADPVFPGTITVYATIANVGQLSVATPFVVDFDVAGIIYPVTVSSSIPANGTMMVSVSVPTPAFGDHDLTVIADANGSVAELDESNNIGTAKLCWDFEPVNFKCNGAPPFRTTQFICNPIDLNIGVLNHGIYEATNLKVKFEVNGPGLGGWTNLGFATTFLDNTCGCPLIVGIPSSFLFPQVGSYQVRITADYANLYNECFENNNQIILPVTVVENADYAVYSQFIAPSKLNPDVNEAITFNLTYKNEGCTGLSPIELYMQMDNTPHDSVNAIALASSASNTYAMPHSWSSALPGVHVIRSIIDHNHVIAEGNELNNEATRAVIVGGAPNFNLFELASSSMSPSNGQTITLTASVTNEGVTHADGSLQFYFVNAQNEEVLISQQLIHLAEDETVEETTTWFVTFPPARLIARVSNVEPLEYNFTDNEQQLQLNNLAVVTSSTDVACADITLGKLKAIVTGGQAPYFILWSNGYTGDSINVPSGTFSVLVTDFNGLTAMAFDTVMDLALPVTWYRDLDNDEFGNPAVTQIACAQPSGYVGTGTDCNDNNALIFPDAPELADGKDNDCDGLIDEGISVLNVEAGDCEIAYLGYGPSQCVTLTVNAVGGVTPYTYAWSHGPTTQSTSVCPVATKIYTVTVTDQNGNTAKDKVTVQVIDIRCGNNNDKVVVCHLPPGNPTNEQIICVAPSAVPAHLAHGDYLGICSAVDPCDQPIQTLSQFDELNFSAAENQNEMNALTVSENREDGVFSIYPNPANTFLQLNLPGVGIMYSVTLHDVTGKLMLSRSFESGKQTLSTTTLDNGIYIIQIRSASEKMSSAIVVLH